MLDPYNYKAKDDQFLQSLNYLRVYIEHFSRQPNNKSFSPCLVIPVREHKTYEFVLLMSPKLPGYSTTLKII